MSPRRYLLLFGVLVAIYNLNLRWIGSGDCEPARVLPLSIWLHGNLYLDHWVECYRGVQWPTDPIFVVPARGHWLSLYPVTTPILVAPLYLPLALAMRLLGWSGNEPAALQAIEATGKLAASILAALSALVLLHLLRGRLGPRRALTVTLLYALASNTWATSSQALWQHGASQLLILLTLALLRRNRLGWAGAAAALAVTNRPPNLIFLLGMSLYVGLTWGRQSWRFFPAIPFILAAQAAYGLYFFGNPAGAQAAGGGWTTAWRLGLYGLLLSPSRGLLVYTPWTALSAVGALMAWLRPARPAEVLRPLSLIVAGELLLYSFWGSYWGGGSFGPRLISDLLPLLALLTVPLVQAAPRLLLGLVLLPLGLYGAAVQALGAFFWFPTDFAGAERWSDCQLARTVRTWRLETPAFWGTGPFFEHARVLVDRLLAQPPPAPALTDFSQSISLEQPFASLPPGVAAGFLVHLHNSGKQAWIARDSFGGYRPVHLMGVWLDARGLPVLETPHYALPADVAAGSDTTVRVELRTPTPVGSYRLRLTMVQEGVARFDDRGGPGLDLPVTLTDRSLVDLSLGGPKARPALRGGFSADEGTFVWSDGPESTLEVDLPRAADRCDLWVQAYTLQPLGIEPMSVSVNGQVAAWLSVGQDIWYAASLSRPLAQGANQLTFRYRITGRPMDLMPGSQDYRDLAVCYRRIRLVQP